MGPVLLLIDLGANFPQEKFSIRSTANGWGISTDLKDFWSLVEIYSGDVDGLDLQGQRVVVNWLLWACSWAFVGLCGFYRSVYWLAALLTDRIQNPLIGNVIANKGCEDQGMLIWWLIRLNGWRT